MAAAAVLLQAVLFQSLVAQAFVPAQSARVRDLAAGKFLVANRNLLDPNFAQTVVLLVQHDEQGAMGLIINRRTKVPLSRVLQEMKVAKDRSDPVYAGGPVGRTGVLALLRSRTKPEEGRHVLADIYLISSKALLEKTLGAGTESSLFHVYLGYSGWAAGQLEREVEMGGWYIFRGDADMVFDRNPRSVWSRLIRQTELQVALAARGGSRGMLNACAALTGFLEDGEVVSGFAGRTGEVSVE